MPYLRLSEFVEILKQFDQSLPAIVHRDANCHDFAIKKSDISLVKSAYFPDCEPDRFFETDKLFLKIAEI